MLSGQQLKTQTIIVHGTAFCRIDLKMSVLPVQQIVSSVKIAASDIGLAA
jgi:hypothetical protein